MILFVCILPAQGGAEWGLDCPGRGTHSPGQYLGHGTPADTALCWNPNGNVRQPEHILQVCSETKGRDTSQAFISSSIKSEHLCLLQALHTSVSPELTQGTQQPLHFHPTQQHRKFLRQPPGQSEGSARCAPALKQSKRDVLGSVPQPWAAGTSPASLPTLPAAKDLPAAAARLTRAAQP